MTTTPLAFVDVATTGLTSDDEPWEMHGGSRASWVDWKSSHPDIFGGDS